MTTTQAKRADLLHRKYFTRRLGDATRARIESGGVLLPVASVWALISAAHLTWFLSRYDAWLYRFSWLVTHDLDWYAFIVEHAGWLVIGLWFVGAIGLGLWWTPRPRTGDGHPLATIVGAATLALAALTADETLPIALGCMGMFAILNIVSVLLRGHPVRTPTRRRPAPKHPSIEDIS